jgi:hypothetical protein
LALPVIPDHRLNAQRVPYRRHVSTVVKAGAVGILPFVLFLLMLWTSAACDFVRAWILSARF